MREKLAVQLYTLRKECEQDFPGVLHELSRRGWAGVQFAGYHGHEPEKLAEILKETGLRAAGLHVGYDQLAAGSDTIVRDAAILGTRDIICPFVQPARRTEQGYREIKQTLQQFARRVKDRGYRTSYHHHAFEFETTVDSVSALEFILEPTAADNLILAEIDVYWIRKAGLDPLSFMDAYANRMPIIHLKDITVDKEQAFAEVGTGVIDFVPVLQWGERNGIEWYVVEQDVCPRDAMDCLQTSYEQLTRMIESERFREDMLP